MKFYADRFRHSSNIKVIYYLKIWEIAMLASLMGGIYEVRH
jgi:hypothetical protein